MQLDLSSLRFRSFSFRLKSSFFPLGSFSLQLELFLLKVLPLEVAERGAPVGHGSGCAVRVFADRG